MSQLRQKIKICLQALTRSIKQVPEDRREMVSFRVNKVLQKYMGQQADESLQKFKKELDFNLNFIKLSYPNLNFSTEETNEKSPTEQISEQQQAKKEEQISQATLQQLFELQNSDALKKQMRKISEIRQEVDFSNWSEGNIDPENLKRHKQLLTRQHFGGDFWKGKEIPRFESAKTLAQIMQTMDPPKMTDKDLQKKQVKFDYDPESAFTKVKR